jgi:Nitrile hydratase beta subunit, C-terminal
MDDRRPRRHGSKWATACARKTFTQRRIRACPRYARGHVGVVERLHGAHIFPDSAAAGKGEDPQWLYTVRFDAQELWGADAEPNLKVSIEAFEPYLEHV